MVYLSLWLSKVIYHISEGLCYIPNWMFKMLNFMEEGSPAQISLVHDLRQKKAKTPYFIKLRPHKTKFIELDNPKAVL